jgi:hypothetical protein
MNRATKVRAMFALLVMMAIAALAADPWISFGRPGQPGAKAGVGFTPYRGLSVIAPDISNRGKIVLTDPAILGQTGGGMLVSTAEPRQGTNPTGLRVVYDRSKEDGSRFKVVIDGAEADMDLFDWEGKPFVEFAESGHNGAIDTELDAGTETITLDDAFQGRLMGLRFIQADLMIRGLIASQRYLPRDQNGLILGAGERQWLGSKESVSAAEASVLSLAAGIDTMYTVLTDAGREFTFYVKDGQFVIDGKPYYLAWDPSPDGTKVVQNAILNRRFSKSYDLLRQSNPLVIRSAERAFRNVSFFRYQKQTNPANWRSLVKQVSTCVIPSVPTPRQLKSS